MCRCTCSSQRSPWTTIRLSGDFLNFTDCWGPSRTENKLPHLLGHIAKCAENIIFVHFSVHVSFSLKRRHWSVARLFMVVVNLGTLKIISYSYWSMLGEQIKKRLNLKLKSDAIPLSTFPWECQNHLHIDWLIELDWIFFSQTKCWSKYLRSVSV